MTYRPAGKIARGIYVPAGSLDRWRAARDAAATQRAEVCVFGDSTVYANSQTGPNYSWVQRLRQLIRADNAAKDGGLGYFNHFQVNSNANGGSSFLWSPESGSPWSASGWADHNSYAYTLPGIISSHTAGETVTVTVPATHRSGGTLRIWRPLYGGTGFSSGAQFTYSINGAAAVLLGSPADISAISGNAKPINNTAGGWSMTCLEIAGINPGDVIVFTALGGIYEGAAAFSGGQAFGIYDGGAGGTLAAGSYWYKCTKAGAGGGETLPSSSVTITVAANHTVHLRINSDLASGTWNIYRATASGGPYLLIGSVTDSTGRGGPGASDLEFVDDGKSTTAAQPPTVATPALNTYITNSIFGLDLLNSTGIVFHNHGLPASVWTTYFDPADTAHSLTAATMLGLTSYVARSDVAADELKTGGASPRRPVLAIAQFGVNDLNGYSSINVAGAINLFISMCRNGNIDPLVVIPTLYNRAGRKADGGALRRDIMAVCSSWGAACVDFQEALGPIATMADRGFFLSDVHLPHAAYNAEGDWLWNSVLSAAALP